MVVIANVQTGIQLLCTWHWKHGSTYQIWYQGAQGTALRSLPVALHGNSSALATSNFLVTFWLIYRTDGSLPFSMVKSDLVLRWQNRRWEKGNQMIEWAKRKLAIAIARREGLKPFHSQVQKVHVMYECRSENWYKWVYSSFIWESYEKPSSSYCVMSYFWWGCRRSLKSITPGQGFGLLTGIGPWR